MLSLRVASLSTRLKIKYLLHIVIYTAHWRNFVKYSHEPLIGFMNHEREKKSQLPIYRVQHGCTRSALVTIKNQRYLSYNFVVANTHMQFSRDSYVALSGYSKSNKK